MIIGCQCGNYRTTREWDGGVGAYYYYYECISCNYYWEGAIFNGLAPQGYYEENTDDGGDVINEQNA